MLPARSVAIIANVMVEGEKTHPDNEWRFLTPDVHLDHALKHIITYLSGDAADPDEELSHAACRLLMALEVHTAKEKS